MQRGLQRSEGVFQIVLNLAELRPDLIQELPHQRPRTALHQAEAVFRGRHHGRDLRRNGRADQKRTNKGNPFHCATLAHLGPPRSAP